MAKQRSDVQNQLAELLFKEGVTQKQETSFCQAMCDGKLPSVIPDVKRFPAAMALSPKGSRLPTTWRPSRAGRRLRTGLVLRRSRVRKRWLRPTS